MQQQLVQCTENRVTESGCLIQQLRARKLLDALN